MRDARIRFPASIRAGETPSEVDCVRLFMHNDLISHQVIHSEDKLKVTEPEMNQWIGIMFAMTKSPVPNLVDFRKEQNDGFLTAQRFGAKLKMGKTRFKFIRKHFKTGAICTVISSHSRLLSGCRSHQYSQSIQAGSVGHRAHMENQELAAQIISDYGYDTCELIPCL